MSEYGVVKPCPVCGPNKKPLDRPTIYAGCISCATCGMTLSIDVWQDDNQAGRPYQRPISGK